MQASRICFYRINHIPFFFQHSEQSRKHNFYSPHIYVAFLNMLDHETQSTAIYRRLQ